MKKLLALLLISSSIFAEDLIVKGILLKNCSGSTIWDVDNNEHIGQPDIELTDLTLGKFHIQKDEGFGISVRMVGIVSTLLKL